MTLPGQARRGLSVALAPEASRWALRALTRWAPRWFRDLVAVRLLRDPRWGSDGRVLRDPALARLQQISLMQDQTLEYAPQFVKESLRGSVWRVNDKELLQYFF